MGKSLKRYVAFQVKGETIIVHRESAVLPDGGTEKRNKDKTLHRDRESPALYKDWTIELTVGRNETYSKQL